MLRDILVIDRGDRESFWRSLKVDYKILFASTATKGMEMLSDDVGLVFLNLKQPDMDGIVALKMIKNQYPLTAVVVLVSPGTEDACIEAFRNGALDYIKKPVMSEEVLRKIKILTAIGHNSRRQGHAPLATEDGLEQYSHIPSHLVNGVLKVRDFIDSNYSDSLTLPDACKMASLSKTYFCHFFKSVTGYSLRQYHHVVRVRIAEELLKDRRLSITDVALRLGYSDSNYFSTIYKKINGVPPRHRRTAVSMQGRYELEYSSRYFRR